MLRSEAYMFLDPPNYPLLYPKYPLLRTIRALLKGHLGGPGWIGFCFEFKA